jgi:predicted restriction endonuclease
MVTIRQKVTPEQVHLAYDKAKYVYEHPGTITKSAIVTDLHLTHGINKGTAHDFLIIFNHLLEGKVFKRALSEYAMDYFLFNIKRDYGINYLQKSLSALMLHITYREEGNPETGRKSISQKSMRRLYNKFSNQLLTRNDEVTEITLSDIVEQEIISKQIRTTYKSKEELKRAIEKLEYQPLEVVTIANTSFKRNNVVISLLKQYRGYECQICQTSIIKSDGSRYVEAAHIDPHHRGGKATLRNIILLCPNHHKEFDLGQSTVQYSNDGNFVDVTLNGKMHRLTLQ